MQFYISNHYKMSNNWRTKIQFVWFVVSSVVYKNIFVFSSNNGSKPTTFFVNKVVWSTRKKILVKFIVHVVLYKNCYLKNYPECSTCSSCLDPNNFSIWGDTSCNMWYFKPQHNKIIVLKTSPPQYFLLLLRQ